MPEARAIISHCVGETRNVREPWMVAVETLVQGLEAEKVGGGFGSSSAALALPSNCWCIVGHGQDGSLANILVVAYNVELGNGTRQLEVGVCNATGRVLETD